MLEVPFGDIFSSACAWTAILAASVRGEVVRKETVLANCIPAPSVAVWRFASRETLVGPSFGS